MSRSGGGASRKAAGTYHCALLGVVCILSTGCQALRDGDFDGEALFTVSGQVMELEEPTGNDPVELSVVWWNFFQGFDAVHPQRVPIPEATFPLGFTAPLLDVPAPEMLMDASPPECTEPVREQILEEVDDQRADIDAEWPLIEELVLIWLVAPGRIEGVNIDTLVEKGAFPILSAQGLVPTTEAEAQLLIGCFILAVQLVSDPEYLERGYEGQIGIGYIVAYVDRDHDGRLRLGPMFSDEEPVDSVLALSIQHVLLYTTELNKAARDSLAEDTDFIANPEAVTTGFQLASIECGTDGNARFRVVENAPTQLWPKRKILENPDQCLLFSAEEE